MQAARINVSGNFIHIGDPTPLIEMLESFYKAVYRDGDEVVIVDTGSTKAQIKILRKALGRFPGARLIERPDLAKEFAPLAEKYLSAADLEAFERITKRKAGILNFAEARQVAMDASKNEIIFWCDSDDVIVERHPGRLRESVDRIFADPRANVLFLPYHYGFDQDGALNTLLSRERFIRRNNYVWRGRCHEAIVDPTGAEIPGAVLDESIGAYILHTEHRNPSFASDFRNYLILRAEYDETKKNNTVDARTVLYLGNACRGLRKFEDALRLYDEFDKVSGSVEDRYNALQHRAQIYMDPEVQRPLDAMTCFQRCIELNCKNPRGYFGLQTVYYALHRHEESLHWYELGRNFPMPAYSIFSYNPGQVDYYPHIMAALSYIELGNAEKAAECGRKVVQGRQTQDAQQAAAHIHDKIIDLKLTESMRMVSQMSTDAPGQERILTSIIKEAARIPEGMKKLGLGRTMEASEDPREPKPSIVFYCPPTGEPWGPISSPEIGSGGSEKMVIILANALQATGKVNVTVFSDNYPEERGVNSTTGVLWEHHSAFKDQRCDVCVFWRCPEIATFSSVRAGKRVLWLHDVTDAHRITEELLLTVDYVQVQSQFHAEPIRARFENSEHAQLWVARNAILPPTKFEGKRNPKQVLYCSSPDRGLLTALKIFEEAKKTDPDLTMVVAYGVTPFARKMFAQNNHRHIAELGYAMSTDEYERECNRRMDELGVRSVRRVGWEQLSKLMSESGIWLYPTKFPEISCMSAMEAMAHGLEMVCTTFGALEETLGDSDYHEIFPSDSLDKAGANLAGVSQTNLSDGYREVMAKQALNRFNVTDLAEQWLTKLGLSGASAGVEEGKDTVRAGVAELSSKA